MADSKVCLGHSERCSRVNKIRKMLDSPQQTPDENLRILIKKGPNKENTSLKELDENYASKPEWKVIEGGGVLSIPMEELRMINPPRPDASGNVRFVEKRGKGAKNQIEEYPISQTICNLNEKILSNYNKEEMMTKLEMPALILRSLSLKAISALRDLGLNFSTDIEIDLVLAIVSGDFLHVVACAVKRVDSYPWQKESSLPNRQAVNKAENRLTKDVEVLMNILAGIPQVISSSTL